MLEAANLSSYANSGLQRGRHDLTWDGGRVELTESSPTVCVGICDDPLGLEDGSISDSMITASSTLNIRTTDNCQPYNARLNHVAADNETVGGWCPSDSDKERPWLQVDLLHQVQIEGVIIQGSPDPLNTPDWDDWVTEYQVQYSDSQTDWTYVSEPSSTTAQTFQGNTDLTTPVKSLFKKPIYARYIRIRPTAYHVWPSMRIELIGCRASIFQITGCSSNISCLADAKSRFISVSWPALNRSASHLVLQYASHEPGDLFPVGNITKVKHTTLSQGGKTRSCDFFVTVTGVNITCPENITVSANLNNFAYVFWSPPVLSFSGVDQSVTVISDHDQGQRFDIGTTLVTNRVLETESQCQFSVTVKDTNPPRFFPACPAYIFRLVDISIPSVSVSWSAFNASDSSPPLLWNSSHQPGDVFQTGEDTVVTYEVTDQEGNSAYCNFTVTVTGVEFQCPANITVATDTGINTTSVSWMQPKVTFNSMNGQASTTENGSGFYDDEDYNYDGGDGSSDNRIDGSDVYQRDNRETGVRLQSDHQPGDLFSIGATQVIYQVQETEIECRFHVIVEDDEPPKVSGCPDDVIIPVTSSSQLVTHSWIPPILTDNSGQDVRVTFNCLPTTFSECNRAGNGSFSVGDTTVRYTARDMSGNRNVCAFTVTVTVVNIVCPANITAFASAGSTTTSVSWSEPVVTGWKGETNFTSNYSPGMTLPIGTYRVSYQQWFAEDDLPLECFFFVVVEGQCPAHNTSDGLRWPAAVAGSVTKSVKRCALTTANAGQPVAVRNCLREKAPLYFRWEEYANQSCGEVEKEVTLENVVEVEVSKANAVEVAGFLASQTSKSSEDAQDFEAVSSILENIAEAGSGNVKVAELVLDTVSNVILTVGRTTDTESQPTKIDAKSSSAIVQSVEAQISLTLQQEGQISIRQDSIHVEAVSLDSTLATEGLSFVSVKQSTTLDPRQGPLAHTDVKTLHSTVIPKDLDVLASAQLPSNIIGLLQSPNANKTSGQLQASFLIYADDTLFQSASLRKYRGENNSTRKVAGSVVSLTVENVELINLTEPLVIAFKVISEITYQYKLVIKTEALETFSAFVTAKNGLVSDFRYKN
ncbi:uncharacterized protein LOC110978239 [Acanthaster planci]|uniref:Uncharacterized protein LOC110978239 n=1 Tax=Acanthaster planci TaxID=133434 RepID=A0A8B7Y6B3_ACAPL|nr:uncharacterized protein LOC110978239 [Acanthaster planci]